MRTTTYRPRLRPGIKVQAVDVFTFDDALWEISSVSQGTVSFVGRDGLWTVEDFWENFEPVLLAPGMRLQEEIAGSEDKVYLIEAAMGDDWYRLARWREDRALTAQELWEGFRLLDTHRTSRFKMLDFLYDSGIELGDAAVYSVEELRELVPEVELVYPPANDYIPTDEDIRRVHSDPIRWADPGQSLASFERWLADRDARIYAEARRDIEEELGVEPIEES